MKNYFDDIVKNLSAIVKFDSSQGEAKENMPFGEENAKCLGFFLSLADFLGFETVNYDNYAGEVLFGSGEDFAVLCHLDVVKAGSGWEHEPFGGEIDGTNGKIWGRGTMDDKGPAIITLYAMKALKDAGFKPKKRIHLIVGCNEESGWECIEHYKKVAKMPDVGISPDADFPVIYAEKGILHVTLALPVSGGFTGLKGGNAANMVCDYCEVEAPFDGARAKKFNLVCEGGKIVSRGKSAHGSTPEKGVNAMRPVLEYLGLQDYAEMLFDKKLGLKDWKDETGELTLSPNVVKQEGNTVFVTCDIRYPATYAKDKALEVIGANGYPYAVEHEQPPLYNDANGELIQTLLSVYNQVTGLNAKPVAIGGGTYARALKYGAAFGPEEDGEECTIHQPNEYITFEKIRKCFDIYYLALKKLTEK